MSEWTDSGVFRLKGELRRQRRLAEASIALHTTLDLREILELIVAAATEGVEADRGTVFVMSRDGKEIWSQVVSGEESLEIRLPMGKGIAGTVAQTGKTIRIDDAYADERFDASWDRTSGYRTRQILCRPIRSREGEIAGVFQLLNKREGTFDEADDAYLDALSTHAALALENAQLHRAALEKERQDREIGLVQDVQRAYQPERAALEVGAFQVAGVNFLCEDASGDYYDFFPLESGRHAIVIGDVSGHGLKSALVMAQARAFLRAFCSTVGSLEDIVNRLDACLVQDLTGGTFMSMIVGVLDPDTGSLSWCNAGHPPAILLRARDGSIEHLEPSGRILGILPGEGDRAGKDVTLDLGDWLVLYTDGATEATDPEGAMFGEERLQEILVGSVGKEPAALLDVVHAALRRWTGSDALKDDLTLVAVKRVR